MSFADEHGIPDEETPAEEVPGDENETMDACREALQEFVNMAGRIKREFGLVEESAEEEAPESGPMPKMPLKKKDTALSAMSDALAKEE